MKKLHFHIGPHKTGSTALQRYFKTHAGLVLEQAGWHYDYDVITAKTAIHMLPEDLVKLVAHVALIKHDKILIINEDFCGDFPIRNGVKTLYPDLITHIDMLETAFADYDITYSFCHRSMGDWLHSVYYQNLKHRGGLRSFDRFIKVSDLPETWTQILENLLARLGSACTIIDYEAAGADLHRRLLEALGADGGDFPAMPRANVSGDTAMIRLLEQINQTNSSHRQKSETKQVLLNQTDVDLALVRLESVVAIENGEFRDWPPRAVTFPDFPDLTDRIARDLTYDAQPDLMPDTDILLDQYRTKLLPEITDAPTVSRARMEDQEALLRFELQGKSELHLMHAMAVSYLRRNTDHTQKARIIFHRLWNEEHALILGTLKTRWFISAFQTFADHGLSADQRQIGAAGYFYANMIKVHEVERSFDGLERDATYAHIKPETRQGFGGLDRYKLGNSDILPNMNAHLLALAALDETAGRLVVEFMRRARKAHTIFSRMDANRISHKIENENFPNAWSFGARPDR